MRVPCGGGGTLVALHPLSDMAETGPHRSRTIALAVVIALLIVVAAFLVAAYRPPIPRIKVPARASFDPQLVDRGAALARIGNCQSCHSAPNGSSYSGGVPIRTVFGTIYGSNITPDPRHGIGNWSLAAFTRAMRKGVARDGSHLYPAFPYDHFTRLSDGDIAALYAFVMTLAPAATDPPANHLVPPLGVRPLIAAWKWIEFKPASITRDPAHDDMWNEGRYLVDALAHCGSCHTPRNGLQAEDRARRFDGAMIDGWYAPPLNVRSPAVRAWTTDRLEIYLRTGLDPHHAAAAGPMRDVATNLARAPVPAVHAIATYIADGMVTAPAARIEPPLIDRGALAARQFPEGATLFAGACATCHEPGAGMIVAGRPQLPLGTPLHEDNPRDVIQIILNGLQPPVGPRGPYMPAFADTLTDAEIAQLVGYLHARYGNGARWDGLEKAIADARKVKR